ncbi:MAG: TolC family protein [Cyclobacteriaceae bacterium]
MNNKYSLLIMFILATCSAWAQPRVILLQDAVNIALDNNLSVKRSQLSLDGAQVNNLQSKANFLPSANLGANYGANFGRSIDPTTNDFIAQQINAAGMSGNANLTLFSGLRQYNSLMQSMKNIESAEQDLEFTRNRITMNVIMFYLNVIFNKELVSNANYQLTSSKNQLERTRKLVNSGALPRTNELELVSQVASNDVTLINAQNNLDLALLNLKQALMIPASEEIDVSAPEIETSQIIELESGVDKVYESALSSMPEIKSADLGVESAILGLKISKGAALPSLSASAGFNTNYSGVLANRFVPDGSFQVETDASGNPVTSITPFITQSGELVQQVSYTLGGSTERYGVTDQFSDNLSYFIGVGLNIPIFTRLQTHSSIQRSKISLSQAEITALESRNTLRQDIETAYNNAEAALKTLEASQRQVDALEETFRSIENQYNLGAANFTDYQVANNNLFRAKSDLTRAKFDYVFTQKIIDFYLGNPINLD